MKYILPIITSMLALISGVATAQTIPEQKTMSRLNAGAYTGPYHTSNKNEAWIMLSDGENYYRITNEKLRNDVASDWIDTIEVLKDIDANEKFGEEPKNGVVVIKLKTDKEEVKEYLEKVKKSYYNK